MAPFIGPQSQAFLDYKGGVSLDDNPYPEGSPAHGVWQAYMTHFYDKEMAHEASRSNRAPVRQSPVPAPRSNV